MGFEFKGMPSLNDWQTYQAVNVKIRKIVKRGLDMEQLEIQIESVCKINENPNL